MLKLHPHFIHGEVHDETHGASKQRRKASPQQNGRFRVRQHHSPFGAFTGVSSVFEVHGEIDHADLVAVIGGEAGGQSVKAAASGETLRQVCWRPHLRVQVFSFHAQVGVDDVEADQEPGDHRPLLLHHQGVGLIEFAVATK